MHAEIQVMPFSYIEISESILETNTMLLGLVRLVKAVCPIPGKFESSQEDKDQLRKKMYQYTKLEECWE
jgi:hypothetical protein